MSSPHPIAARPTAPQRQRSAFSPRDVLYVLFRHRTQTLAAFFVVFTLTTAAAVLLPDRYRSEAELTVTLGRESGAIDPTATIGEFARPMQDRDNELNTEAGLLSSRAVAEAAAREVGPARILGKAPRDAEVAVAEAADELLANVATGIQPDSTILTVAYEASDRELARDVVSAWVDAYREVRRRVFRNETGEGFFAEQRAAAERELAEVRARLRDFKDATGVADVGVQRGILLNRIGDLEAAIDAARADRAAALATAERLAARVEALPSQIVSASTTGAPNSSIEALRTRLTELRLEEQDLASRFRDGDPNLRRVRGQVAEAERLLRDAEVAAETTTSVNPVREQLAMRVETERATAEAMTAKLGRLEADLATARGGLEKLNAAQVTVDDLERRAAIAAENVRELASRYNIARFDREAELANISNISVSAPAHLPVKPSGPNRKLLLVAGVIMATLFAGAVAFASEALDHRVARPDDLLAVGPPASGLADACVSIPRLKSGQAAAKGAADYFDDVLQSIRLIFGTASQRGTDVAVGTRRQARGIVAAGRYIAYASVREVAVGTGRALMWVGHRVVEVVGVVLLPYSRAPSRIARRRLEPAPAAAGGYDGGLSLGDDELHDEEPDLDPTHEPRAAPERRVGRSVRLVTWAMRRDFQAWRRRDERPNLQVAGRRSRAAASAALWRSARGLLEQIVLEADRAGRGGRVPPTLAVIAVRPGAGTSTVASHLAGVLAERVLEDTERRDGDVGDKKPALLLSPRPGTEAGVRTDAEGNENLPPVEATPVLGLDRLRVEVTRTAEVRKLLDVARRRYRHVVLDLPAVFDEPDPIGRDLGLGEESGPRLAALAEATVLVLEADALRREAAGRATQRLQRAGAEVAVAVLNKRRYPVPQWLYRRS